MPGEHGIRIVTNVNMVMQKSMENASVMQADLQWTLVRQMLHAKNVMASIELWHVIGPEGIQFRHIPVLCVKQNALECYMIKTNAQAETAHLAEAA